MLLQLLENLNHSGQKVDTKIIFRKYKEQPINFDLFENQISFETTKTTAYQMRFLYTIVLFWLAQMTYAQNHSQYRIISSNLGSSGSSQTVQTNKGTYKVSQSIGQSSVIGTYQNNGYYLRQGYQQPLTEGKITQDYDFDLLAKVFPNPFENAIIITFSGPILNNVSVLIFDINSKIVYAQEFLPAQRLGVQIKDVASGTYFLRVSSGKKRFNTKLIKI
ncbi:T9SS type A sorting domain-containing protein [Winogradskyella sp.]|uniref:T9SS type A sorting domain-containing protein n=1 Tax=Winogradskyella sp. TaxID=1883156 RepID=UPI003BABD920